MILIGLLDLAMIFRLHNIWSNGSGSSFHNLFSIISIILLPRILSIFNNYEFFNMIILSCKRMVWKMIGLFCLLISLTSGFYISFISLTVVETKTSSDILFDMLKVFFGFTPAVWNSWDEYNTLGKFTQMGYLFLVQFVISTILAIILSEVFHKIAASNKEEFHYFKATNIIIYQQTSKIMRSTTTIVPLVSNIMDIFKIPIIIGIFLYEVIISKFYYRENENQESVKDLKYFTFFDKDKDYPTDSNTKENGGIIFNSPFVVTPRKFSSFDAGNNLKPVQSISTLGNFKSASTDSLFIDDLLNRRYGGGLDTGDTLKMSRIRSRTHKDPRKDNEIIQKLNQIECLFSEVVNKDVSSKLAPELSNVNDPAVFIGLDNIYKIRETSPLSDAQLVTSIESLSDENDEDP